MTKLTKYLTVKEIEEVIEKVVDSHRHKVFDVFDADDISQEIRTICHKKINRFDPKRKKAEKIKQALENWLNHIVSNSLKNFYRDNYGNKFKKHKKEDDASYQKRMNLAKPMSFFQPEFDYDPSYMDKNWYDAKVYIEAVFDYLPSQYADIFEAWISGQTLPPYYQTRLLKQLKDVKKYVK